MAARQIYSEEINEIREIHNAIEPSRTRKAQKAKAPVKQKLMGVGMLLTLPMSLMLILSREKVIY